VLTDMELAGVFSNLEVRFALLFCCHKPVDCLAACG
jgi:hypothetical protein